jgi:hypothetical protein
MAAGYAHRTVIDRRFAPSDVPAAIRCAIDHRQAFQRDHSRDAGSWPDLSLTQDDLWLAVRDDFRNWLIRLA